MVTITISLLISGERVYIVRTSTQRVKKEREKKNLVPSQPLLTAQVFCYICQLKLSENLVKLKFQVDWSERKSPIRSYNWQQHDQSNTDYKVNIILVSKISQPLDNLNKTLLIFDRVFKFYVFYTPGCLAAISIWIFHSRGWDFVSLRVEFCLLGLSVVMFAYMLRNLAYIADIRQLCFSVERVSTVESIETLIPKFISSHDPGSI